MKTFLWIVGIIIVLSVIPILFVIFNMVFISQITQFKVKASTEYKPLIKGVSVEEVANQTPPTSEDTPDAGDHEAGRKMLLGEDGAIAEGYRVYDDDPEKEVIVAFNDAREESLIFTGNDVFEYVDGRIENKYGSFPSPEFSYIDLVLPVNRKYMLIHGAMESSPYPSERELWQVEYDGLNKTLLSTKPYYAFSRPPKVFVYDEFDEQAVVYYTESYDFAFGGDSSRPRYSVLRIYNSNYPAGLDIIKFGFKAGTVLDVKKVENGYLVTTDPSLPSMADKPRVSARKWKVDIL